LNSGFGATNTISLTPSRIFATLDTHSSIFGNWNILSPQPGQVAINIPKADKFDFTCFVKFLIKLGIKCFPGIEEKS